MNSKSNAANSIDNKKITIESYDKNAKEFSEKFKDLLNIQKRYEFQRFIDLLSGNTILDLGCGSGAHSVFFKEQGFDVTAIDISKEMVKLAQEKGVPAYVQDIEDLKMESHSMSGIWAVTSLLHIPKIKMKSIIKKLHEIMESDGILYVCIKEGEGELLIKDKNANTKRFFSFWFEEEFFDVCENYFELIEHKKIKLKNTVFLQMFFKRKS